MKKWPWFLLAFLIVIADQVSKYWASFYLTAYTPFPVCPMFNLTLAYNTGAAFSFLSGGGLWHRWFFSGFSVIMSAALAIWLWRTPSEDKLQSAGISLVLGGAFGNLIDRVLQGFVVDFIDLYYQHYHFATFNLADSAITIGAVLLILDLVIYRK